MLESPMATSSPDSADSDIQIDGDTVMDFEEINSVNIENIDNQENEVSATNDITENPQSFDVSVTSSVGDNCLPVSPCSSCVEKKEKIIALQKTKLCQKRRLKKNHQIIRSLNREILQLKSVS